jgi:RNA polymerase sigma-70 factor (ECF subfamily)
MANADYDELEGAVARCLDRRDFTAAATLTLERLGPEIFGFLVSTHQSEAEAAEVFSLFSERLWLSFETYQRDCSMRTWAYLLARRTALNYRRDEQRRKQRLRPAKDERLAEIPASLRSETASYLRSERRSRFAALRAALPLADQTLLILRVDRALSWTDLALVLHTPSDGEAPPTLSGRALLREASRLRKRFQLVKARLLELGREAGVVSAPEES